MQINQDLALFSDLAYKTTVVLYLLALAVSLFYYGLVRLANDARRERARVLKNEATPQEAKRRQKVAVGAGAPGAATTDVAADEVEDTGAADVSGIATSSLDEENLPAGLRAETILQRVKRADTFGGITQALVWLAIAVHAAFLVLRGMSANRFPWGNLFEYVAVVTLFAMVAAAVVINRRSMRVMWPWVLTPVTLLLFYGGTKLYAETAPVVPALQSNWFVIHVSTVSIGGGIGLLSGMASLMYLLRRWHPKGQERASSEPSPPRCRMPPSWTPWPTAVRSGPCRSSAWASSSARSGPTPPGAASGAGTRRRRSPSSPGSSTPPTCTPAQPRAGVAPRLPGSTSLLSRRWSSTSSSSTWWSPACTPTLA